MPKIRNRHRSKPTLKAVDRPKELFQENTMGQCDPVKLTHAAWNPPSRINFNSASMVAFIADVKQVGQIRPVLVTVTGVIVDGHRRVTACSYLGLKVTYTVMRKDLDPKTAYASLNKFRRNVQGNEALHVFMAEPFAVTKADRTRFERMQKDVGIEVMRRFVNENGSWLSYEAARRAFNYITMKGVSSPSVKDITLWAHGLRQGWNLKNAVALKMDPKKLVKAITSKKPLKVETTTKVS